jgi:hypothetical protein
MAPKNAVKSETNKIYKAAFELRIIEFWVAQRLLTNPAREPHPRKLSTVGHGRRRVSP